MEDVAAHGRTVLFVSHNLGVIKELCQTAIVLSSGGLDFQGPVVEGLARYSQQIIDDGEGLAVRSTGWGPLHISGRSNGLATTIAGSESFSVEASLDIRESFDSGRLFCKISDSVGNVVVLQRIDCDVLWAGCLAPGRYRLRVEFPALWLAPGVYSASFKFVGHKPGEGNENHLSGQAVLDVTGKTNGKSRASLSPSLRWSLSEGALSLDESDWYMPESPQVLVGEERSGLKSAK
jgi:hypothetical protein